jgi:hypothetical protein
MRKCTICKHEQKDEIEAEFVAWRNPAAIAGDYGLTDRTTVYRHAEALGFGARRKRNVRAALERIIEKADCVEVTASAFVSAVQAYSKINAAGKWIDRTETISLNDLFARISTTELETYAGTETLPAWVSATLTATGPDSQEFASDE